MLLNLINISLLEESEKMNHVRMNKVLRNMALKISSKSKTFKVLVKTREGLQEPPNVVE
jgi:disease resistance protein RPS2